MAYFAYFYLSLYLVEGRTMTRSYRCTRSGFSPIHGLFLFLFALALVRVSGLHSAVADTFSFPQCQSGTTLYLQEQLQRIADGKKLISNSSLVPDFLWERSQTNEPQNAYRWPTFYFSLDTDRNDTNGNGIRECRVKIDLSGFNKSGVYTLGEVQTFENEFRRVLAMYNSALA